MALKPYDKNTIDNEAEREAQALKKQGRRSNFNEHRQNICSDTNSKIKFDKLWRK